ncbi:MAG: hypothetical protein ACI4IJ_05285 [Acutalibacteraceae bacterium]
MNSAKKSSKLALCGILTALSLVIMIVLGLFGVLTYAAPMIAGGLLIVPVKEYGRSTAFTMFGAVSVLALVLVSDKELALFYLLLFGHYPILQPLLDRISTKPVRRIIKAVVFNGCTVLSILLAQVLFGVPIFEEGSPVILMAVLYLTIANLCFVLYDRALRQFYTIYDIKLRPLLNKTFKL